MIGGIAVADVYAGIIFGEICGEKIPALESGTVAVGISLPSWLQAYWWHQPRPVNIIKSLKGWITYNFLNVIFSPGGGQSAGTGNC